VSGLEIIAAWCVGFGRTFCTLFDLDWKYRPKYGRYSICIVYNRLKVPSQITVILIIHC